jgi:hypothetical protein
MVSLLRSPQRSVKQFGSISRVVFRVMVSAFVPHLQSRHGTCKALALLPASLQR